MPPHGKKFGRSKEMQSGTIATETMMLKVEVEEELGC
jgi:hypothetical protein